MKIELNFKKFSTPPNQIDLHRQTSQNGYLLRLADTTLIKHF